MRPIDADKLKEYLLDLKVDGDRKVDKAVQMAINELFPQIIDDQPTVNEWIPCSERLPENNDNVLVSTECDNVMVNYYQPNFREWNDGAYDDVIAWQPLPEPYRGGGSDD